MAEPGERGAGDEGEQGSRPIARQDVMEQAGLAQRHGAVDDELERQQHEAEADEDAPDIVRAEFAARPMKVHIAREQEERATAQRA